jgi:serine/threonine protein kinase
VTELLGSFISGLEIQGAGGAAQECLYIVYPRAETDMDKWLKSKPDQFLASIGEGQKLDRHLYSAMLGLASGMAWLHCEIDGQAGYHRDLKPPNVLLFRDREWTWKIADFGTANVKPIEDTGTKSLTSTKYWSPPEFFEDNGEQDNKTHGRPHDVYSLGCIFAVIATVIVHRWNDAGLPRFERRRCSRKPLDSPDEEQFENESGAFHKCEDAVLEWIQELEETYPDKEKLTAVLKVVKEMLLPYEKRISAWEVDVYLYEATEEWRSEIKDPVPGDLSMAKHDMVVKRLRAVAQESREIDLHKKRTPVSRARDWKRSNDFLLALEEKKWIESSPQMSEDLKRRRELPRGSVEIVSTLPPDTSKKDPIFGYQKEFDGIARGFGQHNIVVLWGLGGIGYVASSMERSSRQCSNAG